VLLERAESADEPTAEQDAPVEPVAEGVEPVVEPAAPVVEEVAEPTDQDFSEAPSPQAPAQRPSGRKRPEAASVSEPGQPSLVDEAANEPSRPIKRKRASVPSWDEIMFGAPTPKPKD